VNEGDKHNMPLYRLANFYAYKTKTRSQYSE